MKYWAFNHVQVPNDFWGFAKTKKLALSNLFEAYFFNSLKEAEKSGHRLVRVEVKQIKKAGE